MWEQLVTDYGYWGLLGGVLVEGEMFVVLAGVAANRGWLDFSLVVLISFAGTLACNQGLFYIGRFYGQSLLRRHPRWLGHVSGVLNALDRHQTLFILASRFLYGMRTLTPFALGLSTISNLRYLALDVAATLVWALLFTGVGYAFGEAGSRFLGDAHVIELMALVAVLVTIYALVMTRKRRSG